MPGLSLPQIIYSLGCTLYYLLAGHPPFPEGNLAQKLAAHAERVPRPLTEVRADVPSELARVVDRTMARDRSLRFQSPAEVAEALVAFCGSRAAQYSAAQVGVLKEAAAETGHVQASLLKTLGDRARATRTESPNKLRRTPR
jgi:eukaryotic-like serine/threonine-protein kinase